MKNRLPLLGISLLGLYAACSDDRPTPVAPDAPVPDAPAAPSAAVVATSGPTGAIFTTTPNGGIVNENVHYLTKDYVYLDGGPRNNAPSTAAGLDAGYYVFQITDPSGQTLLSMDPARCRVFYVGDDGVIERYVPPTDLPAPYAKPSDDWAESGRHADEPCQIENDPTPPALADAGDAAIGGRHDTNTDVDHWGDKQAIVVQMMPYGTTPNPGGVYKAWVTPIQTYVSRNGNLDQVPTQLTARKQPQPCPDFCAAADPGFGPPRSVQKTDNFKVQEAPPQIVIKKLNDVNFNGEKDAADTEIAGWVVTVEEATVLEPVVSTLYTPASFNAAPGMSVTICEELQAGWKFAYALVYVDGVPTSAPVVDGCVTFTVPVTARVIEVLFGNQEPKPDAQITITPPHGVNEVTNEHEVTAEAKIDLLGTGTWVNPPDGTPITFTTDFGDFKDATPGDKESSCTTTAGRCSVILLSDLVGTSTITASMTVTVSGKELTRSTDGIAPNSDEGKKYWVDAYVTVEPDATNGIHESHTFVAKFFAIPKDAPSPTISFDAFAITITPPSTFTAADYTASAPVCTTNPAGDVRTCEVTIISTKRTPAGDPFEATAAGTVTISATVGGVTYSDVLARETDGESTSPSGPYENSDAAEKIYVDGELTWEKLDYATRARLAGATFEVCRTHDFVSATGSFTDVADSCALVQDDQMPDVETPVPGLFRLVELRLGKYRVTETVAPAGYELDPTPQYAELTTAAGEQSLTLDPFLNYKPLHGCTPGYWKQSQHFGSWATPPYYPIAIGGVGPTKLNEVFDFGNARPKYASLGTSTMLEALGWDNSDGIGQVLRHGVAALLNAANPDVFYAYRDSEQAVKDLVDEALASNDQTRINEIHAELAKYNEQLACPLGRADLPQ